MATLRSDWRLDICLVAVGLILTAGIAEAAFPGKDDPRRLLHSLPPPNINYPGFGTTPSDLGAKAPIPLPQPVELPKARPRAPKPPPPAQRSPPQQGSMSIEQADPARKASGHAAVKAPSGLATPSARPPTIATASRATPPLPPAIATAVAPMSPAASVARPLPSSPSKEEQPPSALSASPAASLATATAKSPAEPTASPPAPVAVGSPSQTVSPEASPTLVAMGPTPPASDSAPSPAQDSTSQNEGPDEASYANGGAAAETPSTDDQPAEPAEPATSSEEEGQTAEGGESADGESDEEGPSAGVQAVLGQAEGLRKKGKWEELLQLFQDNPKAGNTVEGLAMTIEALMNARKINYLSVRNAATKLLEKDPNHPYGHWGMGEALANASKPDLAKALEHLGKARAAKNGPGGLTMRYFILWGKKNWLLLLILGGGLIAGGDALRKKRKQAQNQPLTELESLGSAKVSDRAASEGTSNPGSGQGGGAGGGPLASSPVTMAQKVKTFFSGLMGRLRRQPPAVPIESAPKAVPPVQLAETDTPEEDASASGSRNDPDVSHETATTESTGEETLDQPAEEVEENEERSETEAAGEEGSADIEITFEEVEAAEETSNAPSDEERQAEETPDGEPEGEISEDAEAIPADSEAELRPESTEAASTPDEER